MVKARINGIPYCQQKARGNVGATEQWSKAVKAQTANLPKVKGSCRLKVTFFLPPNKYPKDHPYGPDLDNLVKRLCDAMNQTVFADVAGKDGAITELVASKQQVDDPQAAGAEIEIREF